MACGGFGHGVGDAKKRLVVIEPRPRSLVDQEVVQLGLAFRRAVGRELRQQARVAGPDLLEEQAVHERAASTSAPSACRSFGGSGATVGADDRPARTGGSWRRARDVDAGAAVAGGARTVEELQAAMMRLSMTNGPVDQAQIRFLHVPYSARIYMMRVSPRRRERSKIDWIINGTVDQQGLMP